jgi:hypothetical protein
MFLVGQKYDYYSLVIMNETNYVQLNILIYTVFSFLFFFFLTFQRNASRKRNASVPNIPIEYL